MNQFDLETFLDQFGSTMRGRIRDFAGRPDIVAVAAFKQEGWLVARAFQDLPKSWPTELVSIYRKRRSHPEKSRTMQAVALVR